MAKQPKKRKNRVLSLRFKSIAMILIAAVILSVISVTISYYVYSDSMDKHYMALSSNLAKTVASQLSAEDLERYYNEVKKIGAYDDDKYWDDEAYKAAYDAKADAIKDEKYYAMLDMLFDVKDNNDIMYLYVQKLDGDECTYIFDADRADDRCQLGTTHEVSGPTKEADHPENGIPAFITNDQYGWLCTSMEPVRDDDGNPVALVGVDISMDEIMTQRYGYLRNIIIIMSIAAVLLSALILVIINFTLVKPINLLSKAARSFVEDRDQKSKEELSAISKLNIHTGDEVETLSNSIKQMEQDINTYITNLTAVTAEKERIGAELDVATHIQSSMLPSIFPAFTDRMEFDIHATMDPAKEVGGDFYDFFMVDDNHLAIVMADVSGKGVPAALFMVIGKTLIKDHTTPGKELSTVFAEVNNILCESNSEDLFITAFEGVLDLTTGELRFVNAGHELPFIARAGGRFEVFKIHSGFVLAGMEDVRYKFGSTTLAPGDKLFQYTDGVTEATNANNELYGMERLENALNQVVNLTPSEILPAIKSDIDSFVGDAPQFDDITMLCLDFKQYKQNEEETE
ncbi:MAG: SpoIIE family protein phosphatase [Clostridia bacterium]|nr:SpoIIE family protein phosphatase [Clostridia bacterium]